MDGPQYLMGFNASLRTKDLVSRSASSLATWEVFIYLLSARTFFSTFPTGIGRDVPRIDLGDWPIEWSPSFQKTKAFEIPNHSYSKVMEALSKYPLVNAPYQYPVYSNTGINLLGLSNVAANRMASSNASAEPQTHKELVKRDIFEPLGLKSSFFRTPGSPLREHIAVPAKVSEYADFSFGDVDDPAGGQYSSLGDLVTLMKTFLSPTARGGVISAHVMREWLHPLYVWGSSTQQVGAPWEILSPAGKQAYTKGNHINFVSAKNTYESVFFRWKYARVLLQIRAIP